MFVSIRGISAILLLYISSIFLGCNTGQLTGVGTGSETVIGKIVQEDGEPAGKTVVTLLPQGFDPVLNENSGVSGIDTTDSDGRYSITFTSSTIKNYTLQAINIARQTRAISTTIDISASEDSTVVNDISLHKTGSIKVAFSGRPTACGYVYIPGTSYHSYLEKGHAVIDSVPAQVIQQVLYKDSVGQNQSQSLAENIQVWPQITTIVASSGPVFTRKIFLNTSFTGADVAGVVTNFPVLVRLWEDNFHFSQAKPDGGDLGFTKADGEVIPHEIEHWDALKHQAEVWVKVDTVYGNDSTQYISMHWGDSEAVNSSNSSAVFSFDAGYKGVWHLGENGGTILDATANIYNGSKMGNQGRVEGRIGFAQFFDGDGDYTDMGDVCNPEMSSITVCAWIKNSGVNKIKTIVSKSTGNLPNAAYGWLFQIDQDGALEIFMASDSGSWGEPGSFVLASNVWITDSSWHHVAAVIDRSNSDNCRLYIDGADVSALPSGGDITKVGSLVNNFPLRLGSDADDDCQWEGSLDECSIIYRVKSQDFIKLSYMNQKAEDELTVFK